MDWVKELPCDVQMLILNKVYEHRRIPEDLKMDIKIHREWVECKEKLNNIKSVDFYDPDEIALRNEANLKWWYLNRNRRSSIFYGDLF